MIAHRYRGRTEADGQGEGRNDDRGGCKQRRGGLGKAGGDIATDCNVTCSCDGSERKGERWQRGKETRCKVGGLSVPVI